MDRSSYRLQNASIFFILCLPCIAPAQTATRGVLRLEVHIHNYASAAIHEIEDAFQVARQVFRQADVEIEWVECTAALAGKPAPATCNERMRPTSLVVQLPTKRMVKGVPVSRDVFGYAVPGGPRGFATRASLFYDRIASYSTANGSSMDALFGMALAHEIGHLLLGRESHSKKGLMSCPWSKEEIRDAARGRLSFGPLQLAKIQEQTLARVEAEQMAPGVAAD